MDFASNQYRVKCLGSKSLRLIKDEEVFISLSVSVLSLAGCIVFHRKAAGWNQGQSSLVHGCVLFRPHVHAIFKTLSHTQATFSLTVGKHSSVRCVHDVRYSRRYKSITFIAPVGNIPRFHNVDFLF